MRYLVPIFIAFLTLSSCSSSDNGDTPSPNPTPTGFDRTNMLTHWADDIIIPAYQNLSSKNDELEDNIEDFIENPSQATLYSARQAHKQAYLAWQNAAFFEIGPAKNENLRLYANTFPLNAAMVEQLALQPEYNLHLASNASKQGYPAIDYLLNGFGNTDEDIINKYVSHTNAEHYKDYLIAVAERLNSKSSNVLDAWENGYRDSFVENNGSSASASVDLIANDFLLYYEKFFRNGKVRFPVGYSSGTAAPENVEAYYSPLLGKELFIEANNALRNFFEGKNFDGSGSGNSFQSYLIALDKQDISDDIIANFNAVTDAANNLDDSFRNAVVNDRSNFLSLHDRIQANVIPMKVEMMSALSISVAYFDGDGD